MAIGGKCPKCGAEVPVRYCPLCGTDRGAEKSSPDSKPRDEQTDPQDSKLPLSRVGSLSEFVGQQECVDRLKSFGDFYQSKDQVPEHVLLTGPEEIGKTTLAMAFAGSYSHGIKITSAELLEKAGDVTAIVTSMDAGSALIIQNVPALRRPLAELLQEALQDFLVSLRLVDGRNVRVHPFKLNRFTCIATAVRPADVPSALAKCFSLSLHLQAYVASELERIASAFAAQNRLTLADGVARMLANVSDGNPGKIEQLVRRISRLGKQRVTVAEASEILSAFGLNSSHSALPGTYKGPGNINDLNGVEFEHLVTDLLRRIGFRAEMTRATGDGGIDIVAELQRPLLRGRYLVQCKRFADAAVGAAMVREFYGAVVADRRAIKGIFITTSTFTDQAREFAKNLPLELIDGAQFGQLLADHSATDKTF